MRAAQPLYTYARRLRRLMREARWRDEDLAVAAHISVRTVAQLRQSRRPSMRRSTAGMIAQALETRLRRPISVAYVAGERDE